MAGRDEDAGRRGEDVLAAFVDGALLDQKLRMDRLRRAQSFVSGPLFPELRDAPLVVSDSPEALAERAREIDYRIGLVEAVLELLREERGLLDRARPATDAVDAAALDDSPAEPAPPLEPEWMDELLR